MCKVGREADANELLRLLVGRSPEYLPGNLEYAKSAQRRGDWKEAAERWALVRARFPGCAEISDLAAEKCGLIRYAGRGEPGLRRGVC